MDKYGFVYLWYDRKHKRYYVGCHWGTETDGYVCSSPWMRQAYKHRPKDFKRRILKTNIQSRKELYEEELRWLQMIKPTEISPNTDAPKYYNLNIKNNEVWHKYDEHIKSVSQKISRRVKEKYQDPEFCAYVKESYKKRDTRSSDPAVREKRRQSMLGKNKGKDTSKANAAAAAVLRGRPLSDEHKAKLREINSFKAINSTKVKCPHCVTEGQMGAMARWHFSNCKELKKAS